MPNCGNSNFWLSKSHAEPDGCFSPFSDVHHSASRTFTTNQPSLAGARPEPESSSRASGTARVYRSRNALAPPKNAACDRLEQPLPAATHHRVCRCIRSPRSTRSARPADSTDRERDGLLGKPAVAVRGRLTARCGGVASPSVVSASTLAPRRLATSSTVKPSESGSPSCSQAPTAITRTGRFRPRRSRASSPAGCARSPMRAAAAPRLRRSGPLRPR